MENRPTPYASFLIVQSDKLRRAPSVMVTVKLTETLDVSGYLELPQSEQETDLETN